MKNLQVPIRWKITGLSFGILAFSLIIIGIILLGFAKDVKEEEISQRILITAQLVAQNEKVQYSIEQENASALLQPVIEKIRVINNHDYIVILNMDRLRLTHPIQERVGTPFVGGDEARAFSDHIYVSKAKANNKRTVRAFAPIKNSNREQIGVVVVGNILPTAKEIIYQYSHIALIIVFIISLFGFSGSWLLASHIKRTTFKMEPEELARVLVERTATFNAMNEGIIAIDDEARVTLINEAAKTMLSIEKDIIGQKIFDAIPDSRLPEILTLGKALYQRQFYVQNKALLSNRIPITIAGKTVGAVAIFQDKTEVNRLAQELTGVQAFVDALRVQNHEFSNKLHTIAGLIQLEEGKKALEYIYDLSEEQSGISRTLMQQIHDDSIAGLLLGKVSRGKELGIRLLIDKECMFMNYPEGITNHDLVIILGNLIDNSFDVLETSETSVKEVRVLIQENKDDLIIRVSDNGPGIPEYLKDKVVMRGFSTKERTGRGIGLFLVYSIVERVEGTMEMINQQDGCIMIINLPMKRGVQQDGE